MTSIEPAPGPVSREVKAHRVLERPPAHGALVRRQGALGARDHVAARHEAHVPLLHEADPAQLRVLHRALLLVAALRALRRGGAGHLLVLLRRRYGARLRHHLLHVVAPLHQLHVGAAVEPARVLLPRHVVALPVLETAVTIETLGFVAVAGVEEARLGEFLGLLSHAARPVLEGAEARRLGGVTRVDGSGHPDGRRVRRCPHTALVVAHGRCGLERDIAGGRVSPQEGALWCPALMVLSRVVPLDPPHNLDLAEGASHLVPAAQVVEAVSRELVGRKELHGPLVKGLEPLLLAAHVGRFSVEAKGVVVVSFVGGRRRRGGGRRRRRRSIVCLAARTTWKH